MPQWMPQWKTTRTLIAVAVTFWSTDALFACLYVADALRSISQGVAVTTSVLAGMAWMRERERASRKPVRESSPERATYISTHALLDVTPITIEIPRQHSRRPSPRPSPRPALAISGGHASPVARSQEYWDAVADVAETLFERRDDDPPSYWR